MSVATDPALLVYFTIVGFCVGSFLNVVIYRLPAGVSIISPPSHCPECGSPVRFYDNIPLLSWLLLWGHCRDCGGSISSRYFFVELLTGVLTLLVVMKFGVSIASGIFLLFVWGLVAVTFIDLDLQIIPDEISIGGAIAGLMISPFMPTGFENALIGAIAGSGFFYGLAILYPGGMGGGDIKLMAAIGAFLGWQCVALTILLASLLGSIIGISGMLFFGQGRKSRVPFGPFLAFGAIVSLLAGDMMISAYLSNLTPHY